MAFKLLFLECKQSFPDHSLFVMNSTSMIIILLVYVDGAILIGNSLLKIYFVKNHLYSRFHIKDLAPL